MLPKRARVSRVGRRTGAGKRLRLVAMIRIFKRVSGMGKDHRRPCDLCW
ncbi:MAG: hypothetical protein ACLP7A_11035 [Desulfobaccales bacterium]